MITRFLNNDYVLSKVMSFLSTILALLGFTSCGDKITEVEMPLGVLCAYGPPIPSFTVRGEVSGLVTDSVGNPIKNINIRFYPSTPDRRYTFAFNDDGITDEDGKYTTKIRWGLALSEDVDSARIKRNFPTYVAIATDSTGVYENDTLYIDYELKEIERYEFTSTATADFVLRKKKNQ